MPEILYFAPPASLTEMTEVPVLTEGNNEQDKIGIDEQQDQKVRGPRRDELWVTIVSCRKMLPDPQKLARGLSVNLAALAEAVEAGRERRPHPTAGTTALSHGQAVSARATAAVAGSTKRAATGRKRAPGSLPAGPGGEDSAIAIDPGVVVRAGEPATTRRRKSPAATQH